MYYTFDIIGIASTVEFFYHQEKKEKNPQRSKAYLGSDQCSLDAFIKSIERINAKPDWNWDNVFQTIVNFWLKHPDIIEYWKGELQEAGNENLIVARVANLNKLRSEFEVIFEE